MSNLDDIADLLERERKYLVSGNLSALERLAQQKTELVDGMTPADNVDAAKIEDLREAARRNGELLDAVGRGLKSALRQVSEARNFASHSTYGADGSRAVITPRSSKIEQKI